LTLSDDASTFMFLCVFCYDALACRFQLFVFEFCCLYPRPIPPLMGPM
jgi:hypothetical protein